MKIKTFKYYKIVLIVSVMVLSISINAQKSNTENQYDKKENTIIPILEIVEDTIAEEDGCSGLEYNNVSIREVEEPQIYFIVEKMPEFQGGGIELREYIATRIKYPNVSDCTIEGKVYIRFCVTDCGNVEKIRVLRGVDPLLDKEAVRVVKTLPKWIPGEQNGKKVSVWYTVPVLFKLE